MKGSVKLEGFKELEKALAEVGKASTQKAVMRRALKRASQPVVDAATALAKDGPTGNLRGSIRISTQLSKRQKARNRKLQAEGKAAVEMFIGPDYNMAGRHAHLVEFGTAPRMNKGQFAGTMHPGTAPQPFMRPAWDAQGQPTLERLKKLLWAEIEKQAKRNRKKSGWEV